MTRIAAVLVTRNSERWIELTLASVLAQTRRPDEIVIVDDGSTDATREIIDRLSDDRVRIVPSTSTASDRTTRIAANFRQALQQVRHCDVAALGDHDDVWHPNRIGHQAGVLEVLTQDAMIASNGQLVDEQGSMIGGTLRDAFPIPASFADTAPAGRMRSVLRHSVATGGASAVRPAAFADVAIPDGWLHDRWWSLVAAAREQLNVDPEIVIDYRVSPDQQVGLDRGHQERSSVGRVAAGIAGLGESLSRLADLRTLAAIATPSTRPEVSGLRLVRNLL